MLLCQMSMLQFLDALLKICHIKLIVLMQLDLFLFKLSHFSLQSGGKLVLECLHLSLCYCFDIHNANLELSQFCSQLRDLSVYLTLL